MEIHRVVEDDENTWLHTSVIQNRQLSPAALGLLLRLLSDGERFETVADLVEHEGRGDFEIAEFAAQELVAEGHMRLGKPVEIWAVPFGWEMPIELSADKRALLEVLAKSRRPWGSVEARDAVLPRPLNRDGRSRERRRWMERSNELIDAWLDLWNAGLIAEVVKADGEHGSKCAITDAGRAALVEAAEQPRDVED